MKIELNKPLSEVKPFCAKLKPLSHTEQKILNKWIDETLKKGIIERSNSKWRSSIFPVKKPDKFLPDGSIEK